MKASLQGLGHYLWGTIAHPLKTFDELAAETSIRPALMLVGLGLALAYLNMLLFTLFGFDWLGTRGDLPNPTYVGFFGRLRVDTTHWVAIFAGLLPVIELVGMVVVPGMAHLLAKLARGSGTFEQMVNPLVYAVSVPGLAIRSLSELIFGVPVNLISGQPYWWAAAMNGDLGPTTAAIWNVFVIGIYSIFHDLWIVVLGTLALRRVERIPGWAALPIMLVSYVIWMYGIVAVYAR